MVDAINSTCVVLAKVASKGNIYEVRKVKYRSPSYVQERKKYTDTEESTVLHKQEPKILQVPTPK